LNNHPELTRLSAMNTNALVAGKLENVFSAFIYDLMLFISAGHSVPENKDIYLRGTGTLEMNNTKVLPL
jgi:phage major head subunit gpT-like protein